MTLQSAAALAALLMASSQAVEQARWALSAIPVEKESATRMKTGLDRLLVAAAASAKNAANLAEKISSAHRRLEKQWGGDRLHPGVDEKLRRAESLVDWRSRNFQRLRKDAAHVDLLFLPDEALSAEKAICERVTSDLNERLKPAEATMKDAEAQCSQEEGLSARAADDMARQTGMLEAQAKELEARLGMLGGPGDDLDPLRLAVLGIFARCQTLSRDAQILAQSADRFEAGYEAFEAGNDDFEGALSEIDSLAASNKNHEAIDEIEDAVRQSAQDEREPDPPPEDAATQVELLPEPAAP